VTKAAPSENRAAEPFDHEAAISLTSPDPTRLVLVPLRRKTELQTIRPPIASTIRRVMPLVAGRGCIGRSGSCALNTYICIRMHIYADRIGGWRFVLERPFEPRLSRHEWARNCFGERLNIRGLQIKSLKGTKRGTKLRLGHEMGERNRRVKDPAARNSSPDADRWEMVKASPRHRQTSIVTQKVITLHDYPASVRCLYTVTFPPTTFATYRPALRNCITFSPARAICAHRDFVSGFCSSPRNWFPSNTKSTSRNRRFGVSRTWDVEVDVCGDCSIQSIEQITKLVSDVEFFQSVGLG
jgi:hypothetical protein